MKTSRVCSSLFLLLIVSIPCIAQSAGVPVCIAPANQYGPLIVSDGAGGGVVAWLDKRSGSGVDIYSQRINGSLLTQWTAAGVPLTSTGKVYNCCQVMTTDGAGGAIVAWEDFRNSQYSDLYAQRIDASGSPVWTANGAAISTDRGDQSSVRIVSDRAGGAIFVWETGATISAQRVNASGARMWGPAGSTVGIYDFNVSPCAVEDGNGGVIVAWLDKRNDPNWDVYAQRLNASGTKQWAESGVLVAGAPGFQSPQEIISDGAGGAIVVWQDEHNLYDIWAQRLSSLGTLLWDPNGVPVTTAAGYQGSPSLCSDGAGGAFVAWDTYKPNVWAQHISGSGVAQFAINGVRLSEFYSQEASIASDGAGGAIVAWADKRNEATPGWGDVYAQRVNGAGSSQWTANGVPVAAIEGSQGGAKVLPDGSGGAIVAWSDGRNPQTAGDVYAQHLGAVGNPAPTGVGGGTSVPSFTVSEVYPNPFSAQTSFDLTLRNESAVSVEVFDAAGHRVRSINERRVLAGASHLVFDGLDSRSHALPSGVYFYRVHAGSETVTKKMVIAR